MTEKQASHIVVIGGGFGGLTFAKTFRHAGTRITLVDRNNHHLFQPLLYQVAAAGLSPAEIAQPIRSILSRRQDVTVLLDEVTDINLAKREIALERDRLSYDYLVLAVGSRTSYFGHPEWEKFAPGLKTIEDALRIRSRILLGFELAEGTKDPIERQKLMTIVIVGGGPTGVELAGAFAELSRTVLKRDFRRIDPSQARIVLIEAGPAILGHLPPELSLSAKRQLERLGVQVRLSTRVQAIRDRELELAGSEMLQAETILWAAGVSATPLTQKLGTELDRAGRVKVNPDLSIPGHPEAFAIGDMALALLPDGKPAPGVSPAAMQMAHHVARIIVDELDLGRGNAPRPPFKYWDRGTMATIGRSAAVAWIGKLKFSGLFAWLTWLFVHLVFLVGFRSKLAVLMQWAYSYFAYKRSARLITGLPERQMKNEE